MSHGHTEANAGKVQHGSSSQSVQQETYVWPLPPFAGHQIAIEVQAPPSSSPSLASYQFPSFLRVEVPSAQAHVPS